MRDKLANIVHSQSTTAGRVFDAVTIFLIIISVVIQTIETLPNLTLFSKQLLSNLELTITVIFTVEYALRFYVADRKRNYMFSVFGIVDLLAILPYYLTFGSVNLQVLRLLRLIRIFRILKIVRYNNAASRYKEAFKSIKEEAILFFCATAVLLYFSSVGIYYFEHEAQPENFASIIHSFWWAVITLTTVGYGDVYPITTGGRFFTCVILLIGLGIVAVPTGLVASALSKIRQQEVE